MTIQPIKTPDSPQLDELCDRLARLAVAQGVQAWPAEALRLCGQAGVYRWFIPQALGGYGWDDADQTRGYLRLAAANLATTFVITQRSGACRRIAGSSNTAMAERWMPRLLSGEVFATVGISHLTTSRQHVSKPVLTATYDGASDVYVLNGFSPWVTGGAHADVLVVGATLDDGRQLLAAVDCQQSGVRPGPGTELVALSASCTDRVDFHDAVVAADQVLAGPIENVMRTGNGGNTGGLQTSTLAIGLAQAAADFLRTEAGQRSDLEAVAQRLAADVADAQSELLAAAEGSVECNVAAIRGRANRLVLRSTQAALTAAKGAGFVAGHPVGRWCQEALFFLVWSCPQPVLQSHLCELAGLQ
ncbi:acyl-CoA dehydrogenase family protein [Roseimaritima ulvae]|uniref:Glutaryl-CoA dehydrogenase n=1 Tax=Roseimaritima ulvae TaxID=980254 RepID=A0A5B9QKP6_9BACT|nr:acyl-CoA dehydrogenase family protein [Roseimaritima ulvae]QEG39648.1 Glutaryl-CoA dehydrogenase [Roseimaritima ulvae]